MKTPWAKIPKLVCKKCGYQWFPRRDELPLCCPNCKNRKWNEDSNASK